MVKQSKDKYICCKKKMYKENHYLNGEDITNYVCLKCGCFIHISSSQLDEDVLEDYRRNAK